MWQDFWITLYIMIENIDSVTITRRSEISELAPLKCMGGIEETQPGVHLYQCPIQEDICLKYCHIVMCPGLFIV